MPHDQLVINIFNQLLSEIITFYLHESKNPVRKTQETARLITAKLWTARKILEEIQEKTDDAALAEASMNLLLKYEKMYRLIESQAYSKAKKITI